MVCIDKFLGKRVEIPEDRWYDVKQGLWVKAEGEDYVFGLTQPALVLAGGVSDLDWLVQDGQRVKKGESVVFAITGKILYVETPIGGAIRLNSSLKRDLSALTSDPYGAGWLFRIKPDAKPEEALSKLRSAMDYYESLKHTEGFRNPEGLKGGVSGICRAVYSGIRDQKL